MLQTPTAIGERLYGFTRFGVTPGGGGAAGVLDKSIVEGDDESVPIEKKRANVGSMQTPFLRHRIQDPSLSRKESIN